MNSISLKFQMLRYFNWPV